MSAKTLHPVHRPMLVLHRPYYDGTRKKWVLQASLLIRGNPVTIQLHTSRDLGERVNRVIRKHVHVAKNQVSFSGETAACQGRSGACPDAAFAGIWEGMDNVMNVVGDVASNPIIAGAVSAIPYGALVVAGVNATVGAYKITRHYTSKKVRDKEKRAAVAKKMMEMNTAAAQGNPQAIEAKRRLSIADKANKMRRRALKGDPKALAWMSSVRNGVASGSAQALEAYALVDGLQKAFGRPEKSAKWPSPRDFLRAADADRADAGDDGSSQLLQGTSQLAQGIMAEYDLDRGTDGAADEIGAQILKQSTALRGAYDPRVRKLNKLFGRILRKRPGKAVA